MECRDAKLARGGAGAAKGVRDPGTMFQTADANLAQLGTVAAVDHTNKHSCICSMRIAECPAFLCAGSARRDTSLDLFLVHGELSMKRGRPAR